jgi:lipopolysaccharide export system protein LptA
MTLFSAPTVEISLPLPGKPLVPAPLEIQHNSGNTQPQSSSNCEENSPIQVEKSTPTPDLKDPTQNLGASITSDKLEISFGETESTFTFTGNVRLAAPAFSAECHAAQILTSGRPTNLSALTSDFDCVKRILIEGPIQLQQGERTCNADQAEIRTEDTVIILSGNVTVKDSMGTISGQEIHINYRTHAIEISSGTTPNAVTIDIPNVPKAPSTDAPILPLKPAN